MKDLDIIDILHDAVDAYLPAISDESSYLQHGMNEFGDAVYDCYD